MKQLYEKDTHRKDTIKISRARRGPDFYQSDHFHNNYELFFLVAGKCRFFLKDSLYSLESGDFVFITPGELHHALYYTDIVCDIIYISFGEGCLLPGLSEHLHQEHILPVHSFMASLPSIYQEELILLLSRMLSEQKMIDKYSTAFLACRLVELLLLLMRNSAMSEPEPELVNAKEADILTATKYIYNNFQRSLTLNEVAGISNLSPTYFSKKFKLITGMGFKEYLNYIRLKNASAALLTTKNPITEIALEYGFNDGNYFTDLFKKEYGMSPREYRKAGEH